MTELVKGIVPTPVGVNRSVRMRDDAERYCPHARGGEPVATETALAVLRIVPTPVGVNRIRIRYWR